MADQELIRVMKEHLDFLAPARYLHIELGRTQYVVLVSSVSAYPQAYVGALSRKKRGAQFDAYPDPLGLEDSQLNRLSTSVLRQLVFKEPGTDRPTQFLLNQLEAMYAGAEDYLYGVRPLRNFLQERGQAAHPDFPAFIMQRRARHHVQLREQIRPGRYWMHRTQRTIYTVISLKGQSALLENERGYQGWWSRGELIRDLAPLPPRTTVCANTTSAPPITT